MAKRPDYFRMMPKQTRGGGVIRFMGAAEGHVMVRRPGCSPFVVRALDWNEWPECDAKGALKP